MLRKVFGLAHQGAAVVETDHRWQAGRDARRAPDLARLAGHGHAGAQQDDVVDGPHHVDDQRGGFVAVRREQLPEPDCHADQVDHQQHHIGAGDGPVEVGLFDHSALGRDVELAQLGVDGGHQHRPHDVPGQHRFVHLVPERIAKPTLDARVGHAGMGQVWQGIGRDHQRGGLEHMRTKQQVGQRRRQKNQAWQAVEEVQHRVEVTQSLAEVEPLAEQRVVGACNLRHASRPADALAHMARQALGGQACSLRHFEVRRVVAQAAELERSVCVFGHSLHRNAAHLQQFLAADDGAGAAEE